MIVFDAESAGGLEGGASLEAVESARREILSNNPRAFDELPPRKADDLATIIYTSGTTGEPKA